MKVELLCVGSELLETHVNTHEAYIGRKLRELGLSLARGTTVPDDLGALTRAVKEALGRCDVLLTSGGLGPTFDDLTREAVAAAAGRKMIFKPALWKDIQAKLSRHRMSIPEENKRQAFLIQGAKVLENARGSAPGQLVPVGRKLVAMMPGPYSELSPIFEDQVLPAIKKRAGASHVRTAVYRMSGIPESVADEKLSGLTKSPPRGARFTILAGNGQVDFHVFINSPTAAEASRLAARIKRQVYDAVGEYLFGEDDATLESALGAALAERRWTIALAESCTGGGAGHRLSAVAGSSRYFLGGVMAYANEAKVTLLGVSEKTLKLHGAVSKECAEEMARGARKSLGATLGLSITGIAGPGGGTAEKPVGLVHVAVAGPGENDLLHRELRLGSERAGIRQRAVTAALNLALRRCRVSP